MTPADLEAILEPKLPSNPICVTSGPLLGLGDHADYTTIAPTFRAMGYDVGYDQDNATSNPEIFDLFYRNNPAYNLGPINLKPNAGYVRQGLFYEIANRLPGYRSIEAMERAHGLQGPYHMAPHINYEPQPTKIDVSDTVLVDFSAVSSKIHRDRIREAMKMMSGRFRNPNFLQILHPPWVVLNQERWIESAYAATSIYEYLDLLASCKAWVGSESGGQALASAIRGEHDVYDMDARPEIVVTSTRQTFNSRGYTFRNVDYRATANDGQNDYHSPLEIETHKYNVMCEVRKVEMANRLTRG